MNNKNISYSGLTNAINSILLDYPSFKTKQELALFCLKIAEEMTDSKFSFLGLVGEDGLLYEEAISNIGWNLCDMYDKRGHRRPPGGFKIRGLFQKVLKSGKNLIANNPPSHPDSIGIPIGHPPIISYFGIPLIYNGETIGILSLANKAGGYKKHDIEIMEALTPAITEVIKRWHVEEDLKNSDKDLKRAQEVAYTGNWRLDIRKNILYWSDEAYYIFGISPSTKLDYETFLEIVHPEDRKYVDKKWRAALKGEPYDIEHRIIVGKQIKWVREKAELEYDGLDVIGGFGITQDITYKKNAEDEIKKLNKKLKKNIKDLSYLASYPELNTNPVLEVDYQGNIVYANPATKKYFPELSRLKSKHPFLLDWETLVKDLKGKSTYYINRDVKVEESWFTQTITYISTNDNFRIYASDITKRKNTEISLAAANRELETFSYSAAHDLKAPLRAIDGYSHMILEQFKDSLDEKSKFYINAIRQATLQLSELLDGIKTLMKSTSSKLIKEEVNLTDIAGNIAEDLKKANPDQNIKFKIKHNIKTECDKNQVYLVLKNLMENAIKYPIYNREIIIEFGVKNFSGQNTYYIKDNGIGFDKEYADLIFKPFTRLVTSKEIPGTGIGLAIVERIIKRHDGRIWAESEKGKGATFYFTLRSG